jgi:hypothetical protein
LVLVALVVLEHLMVTAQMVEIQHSAWLPQPLSVVVVAERLIPQV